MELWKIIKGFESYEISSLGRVKSNLTNKILKPHIMPNGYERLTMSNGVKIYGAYVHRLVALNFIDNPENKTNVNHINSIRNDNRLQNLEWTTPKENTMHSMMYGNNKQDGELHPNSKLLNSDIKDILENKDNVSQRKLAIKYNVSPATICNIINKKTWTKI